MTGRYAVVFDMDGTLIDSLDCITLAYQTAVTRIGARAPSTEELVNVFPLGPPRVILSHFLGRASTTDDERTYLTALREGCPSVHVYDGIQQALSELRACDVRLAVFTGASSAAAHVLLDAKDLSRHFGEIVGGDEVTRAKPHPDGILLALDKLGVEPSNAAYVGDSPLDLQAAAAAGTCPISAAWGHSFQPGSGIGVVATTPSDVPHIIKTTFAV